MPELAYILIIPIAFIVFGLVKKDYPNSGAMVITGFIFLAIFALPVFDSLTGYLNYAGIINFKVLRNINSYFNPVLLLLPVLILLVLGLVGFISKRADSPLFKKIGCFGAVIALLLVAFAAPSHVLSIERASEAATKSYVHLIQMGLDRYAVDKGLYPENIEVLVSAGFMEKLPLNYYTNQPIKDVPYASSDCYGNFTYLPLTVGNETRGYYLLAYGNEDREGPHLVSPDINDHVISEAESNWKYDSVWPSDVPFPDIKTAIESSSK